MTGRRQKKNPYFGEILRAYRLERTLSQEQLSERVDVLRSFISSLENGTRQPSLDMVLRLAKALDITPGKLIDPVAEKMEQK
jgi:transcriptional regulator with XRE-family HTH domain